MMDCKTFSLLLDRPETEWTPEERQAVQAHAAACPDCALLLKLQQEMRAMDADEEIPAAFSASWRQKIRTEDQKMEKKSSGFPWQRVLASAAALVFVAVGTAVSYSNGWGQRNTSASQAYRRSAAVNETADYGGYAAGNYLMTASSADAKYAVASTYDYEYEMAEAIAEDDAASGVASKIIRTVSFTVKTQQYEADFEAIRQLAADYGGRIESLSASGDGTAASLRRANFTLRIPSDQLDAFLADARGVGTVSSYSESSEDVSESYYDLQSRLQTQQTKMARLTELMEQASDVSDLIELENAVSDAQYWIDYYTGRMRGYDSRVNDSYVYVTLREISSAAAAEQKELSLGERIVNAVKASLETAGEVLQAFVIFLIAALPWLAAAAVIVVLVRVLCRRRRQKKD